MTEKSFETRAVHAGAEPVEKHFGAVSVPIYNASLYAFADAEAGGKIHNYEAEGYFYSRLGNPTTDALERALCELERGEDALCFASGMAAITTTILGLVKSGEHLVVPESHYATTGRFLAYLAENFGVETTFIDAADAANYARAARENTKIFYIETPANPTLQITDIAAAARIARARNIISIADNTFATPYNQNPLSLGVDAVVHSATKYLGGHSDLSAGAIVGKARIVDKIRHTTMTLFGGCLAPHTAWLVLRGIKTLALRMEKHNANAARIAEFLAGHRKVEAVFHPSLPTHPNHAIAAGQMRGFGGMIAFDVGSIEAGKTFLNNLRLVTIATSLGGVESVAQHSASMTNANTPKEIREKAGITGGLIRLSVGVENADDLVADLKRALGVI
ncbi:MAG TPA: PLP-dependent aspartate aminotransferase family protein [Pyrinomonadaceae bacterium]|jgi:methionine-gamma-lyase